MREIFMMTALMLATAGGYAYAESFEGAVAFTYAPGPQDDWMGCFEKARYNVGVRLLGEQFPGYKVVGIEATDLFRCDGMQNFTGWASTRLSDDGEPFVPDVELQDIAGGPVDGRMIVRYSSPLEIPEGGLFVGYGMEVSVLDDYTMAPVPMCMGTNTPGSALVHVAMDGYSQWSDYSEMPGCAVCLTVYLEGETPDNYLSVSAVDGSMTFVKGTPFSVALSVSNGGGNAIESLTYAYKIGDRSYEKEMLLENPLPPVMGASNRLELFFDGVDAQGAVDFEISIPKVNGEDNICKTNRVSSRLSIVDYVVRHLPLMEEATGTWCGNCPRGWLGMKELGKELGDDFIGIAYHNGDPMQVTDTYPWSIAGYPDAVIDRGKGLDPFYGSSDNDFGIIDDWRAAAATLTVAEISAKASWVDETKSVMDVNTEVSFALDDDASGYKIGYVLVGNGYCHPENSRWAQVNYYAGQQLDGMMAPLGELPEKIRDMVYDHVAIDTEAFLGVPKSLPYKVRIGETYSHSYWFAATGIYGPYHDNLVENPDNLEVVVLLIDGSGKVVNACKTRPDGGSAVESMESYSDKVEYYDLTGRRVDKPSHGVYIMRRGGVAKKIMF